jgi:hypothetical protein
MKFERQYYEFEQTKVAPPGQEECLCEVGKGSAEGDAE